MDVDSMEEEDWNKFRKNLRKQDWTNASIMSPTNLQTLFTKNVEEAIKQSTKKRRTKKKGKNIPPPIRRFIRKKKKAAKTLREAKELSTDKIRKLTKKIAAAERGIRMWINNKKTRRRGESVEKSQ